MKSFHFSLFLHTSVTWSTVILKCNTFFLTDWVYYDIMQSIWSPVEVCSSLDCCLLLNLFSCWVWINRVGYRATFLQYPDSEPYPILRQALWLHHESMRKKKWEYEQDCCWINSQVFIQFHGFFFFSSPRNVLWVQCVHFSTGCRFWFFLQTSLDRPGPCAGIKLKIGNDSLARYKNKFH